MGCGVCALPQGVLDMISQFNVEVILHQYSSMVSKSHFVWPDLILDKDTQEQLCTQVLRHPHLQSYPPAKEYRRSFTKQLLGRIDDSAHEPAESIVEFLAGLLTEPHDPEYCYKTYWLTNEIPVTVAESQSLISKGTTGLTSWDSGKLFAEYIAERAGEFDGKNILELGCGAGLVASAMQWFCNPTLLTITDLDSEVLQLASRNAELNKSQRAKHAMTAAAQGNLRADILDWCTASDSQLAGYDADIVVATDCVYDASVVGYLSAVMLRLLRFKAGAYALVAAAVRNHDTFQAFLDALDADHLQATELPHPRPVLYYHRDFAPIRLLRIDIRI